MEVLILGREATFKARRITDPTGKGGPTAAVSADPIWADPIWADLIWEDPTWEGPIWADPGPIWVAQETTSWEDLGQTTWEVPDQIWVARIWVALIWPAPWATHSSCLVQTTWLVQICQDQGQT